MRARSLEALVGERLYNSEVAAAVIEDVKRQGTRSKIEAGELVLPSEQDAQHWYDREIAKVKDQTEREKLEARIAALEKQQAEQEATADKGKVPARVRHKTAPTVDDKEGD